MRAIFISYASQDAQAARCICAALRAGGIEVWFDQSELRGGDDWDRQIRRQIQDCALFIPIISSTTQGRTEGYFRREWKLAVNRTHDMSERVAFLVPVVIDDTDDAQADVPDAFRVVQWTRLPAGVTPPAFLTRILQLLSPTESQVPAPARPAIESASSLRPSPPNSAKSRRSTLFPLVIASLIFLTGAYFALDKFVLSKHAIDVAPTIASASLPGEAGVRPINEKSIAVLPFSDLSEKKDQEYFSDGLAEELLDLLAKTPGLHVIARTSSFSFKGKSDDIPTIGKTLNVANILEGSVRKSGNRLRITTQLIRASSGEHIWSETYDRELKDVFAVQDEIATAVVGQLKLKLAPVPPSSARRTSNVEAYNEYLLGWQLANLGNFDGRRRAIEAFHNAIALDPSYAAPYDGLAMTEYAVADPTADASGYQRAKDAAAKAVELGPDDPNGYAARGFIRYIISWDWTGAQADLEMAIALDPGDARFRLRYGQLLATLGRLPEAIAETRKGIELDPLSAAAWGSLTAYLIAIQNFAAAHEASRREFEISSPDSIFALYNLGTLQLLEGRAQDALATFSKFDVVTFRLNGTAMAEYTLKDLKESQRALNELITKYPGDSAYQVLQVYAWRREPDKAFDWLERSYALKDTGLSLMKYDPLLGSLRVDPRYATMLRKMKLPE